MRSQEALPDSEPESDRSPDASRYAVGIVHYRSYADLGRCLESVSAQGLKAATIGVIDVAGEEAKAQPLRDRYPAVDWQIVPNRGFAWAANRVLARIDERCSDARFALILNADIELEPQFCGELIREMRAHPEAALGGGKLLRTDGETLDSAGIALPRHRRPRDRGSEEKDSGQYDKVEYVFGVSGAAMLLRRAALDGLCIDDEIFDEDFFLYHEDTDLAWRAQNLGMRVLYVPSARALHARGWKQSERFEISSDVRRNSFKNHYLQMLKNERPWDFAVNLPILLVWEILRLGFALLRDRAVLGGYRDALRLAGHAWEKRQKLKSRIKDGRTRPGHSL